jgi:hypothetical protein
VRAKFKNVERVVCGNIFVFGRYSRWAQNCLCGYLLPRKRDRVFRGAPFLVFDVDL